MKILRRMLLVHCVKVFLVALVFFVLILQMVDLFGNLWRYLNQDVSLVTILNLQLLYIPKCIFYAVPVSVLFAVAYVLGRLYADNELIALLGAGVSIRYAIFPLLVFGLFLGMALLYFEDKIVISTYAKKNAIAQDIFGQRQNLNNTNVTIRGDVPGVIYSAEYYNDTDLTLSKVTVIMQNNEGGFSQRVDADWAEYTETGWVFYNATIYIQQEDRVTQNRHREFTHELLHDKPSDFQRKQKAIDELTFTEAREYISELERAGQDARKAKTDYYQRIAFAFTPLITAMLSAAIGSRLKKNILLMSLLLSLCISVVFYVFQMITGLLAASGIVYPIAGAFLPAMVFFALGVIMLQLIRT